MSSYKRDRPYMPWYTNQNRIRNWNSIRFNNLGHWDPIPMYRMRSRSIQAEEPGSICAYNGDLCLEIFHKKSSPPSHMFSQ